VSEEAGPSHFFSSGPEVDYPRRLSAVFNGFAANLNAVCLIWNGSACQFSEEPLGCGSPFGSASQFSEDVLDRRCNITNIEYRRQNRFMSRYKEIRDVLQKDSSSETGRGGSAEISFECIRLFQCWCGLAAEELTFFGVLGSRAPPPS
jgi:hypothetical protein